MNKVLLITLMVLVLLAGVGLGPISIYASAQDVSWTTTADFDNGIKENPGDGNYATETNTDNPGIASGVLELASIKGDPFMLVDLDADTFKWTPSAALPNRCTRTLETIASGVLSLNATGVAVDWCGEGFAGVTTISGDFDVRIRLDRIFEDADTHTVRFIMLDTQSPRWDVAGRDGVEIYTVNHNTIRTFNITNGVETQVGTDTANTVDPLWFRIARSTSTYTTYFSSDGSAWTQDETFVRTDLTGLYPTWSIWVHGAVTTWDVHYQFDDFHVAAGTVDSGGFRTSGYWQTGDVIIPENRRLGQLSLTFSSLTSANAIDRILFFNNSVPVEIYETDIISGTSFDYFPSEIIGDNAIVSVRFVLKGNGSASPVLESVSFYYSAIGSGIGTGDLTDLFIAVMLLIVFIFLFIVGLYNRFVMIGAAIISAFIAIQLWVMTENIVLPTFFIFILAICFGIAITKKG